MFIKEAFLEAEQSFDHGLGFVSFSLCDDTQAMGLILHH
jgi:hypothetical protein